jgi:autotransporter-associated beta strand protein
MGLFDSNGGPRLGQDTTTRDPDISFLGYGGFHTSFRLNPLNTTSQVSFRFYERSVALAGNLHSTPGSPNPNTTLRNTLNLGTASSVEDPDFLISPDLYRNVQLSVKRTGKQQYRLEHNVGGTAFSGSFIFDAAPDMAFDMLLIHTQGVNTPAGFLVDDLVVERLASDLTTGERIQLAIDAVGDLPLDEHGFRGAVELEAGEYVIDGTEAIQLRHSGVVLRGAGDGSGGTILRAAGTAQRALVRIAGAGSRAGSGSVRNVTQTHVPAGARSFLVDDASGLGVGQEIMIRRPSTQQWLIDIDMLFELDNPWLPGQRNLVFDRVITHVEGNRVFFDAPLPMSLESKYGSGTLQVYAWPGRVNQVGIERIRGVSDFSGASDENHAFTFVRIENAQNVWARDLTARYFAFAAVTVERGGKWVTVSNVHSIDPISPVEGGFRYAFNINEAELVLFKNCTADNSRHAYVTGSNTSGPNAFVDSLASRARSEVGPHQRWATGALFDNVVVEGDQLAVRNRGNFGTGHGWAGAYMMAWNSVADRFVMQSPTAARTWSIGNVGVEASSDTSGAAGAAPPATIDSHGSPVFPRSLYWAQYQDRRRGSIDGPTEIREYRIESPGTNFSFSFAQPPERPIVAARVTLAVAGNSNPGLRVGTGATLVPSSHYDSSGARVLVANLTGSLGQLTNGSLPVTVDGGGSVEWALLELQLAPIAPAQLLTDPAGAAADAYVRAGASASTNFGTAPTLQVKADGTAGEVRRAFLRWSLPAGDLRLVRARVELHPVAVGSEAVEHVAHLAEPSGWTEGGLTFNNQPDSRHALASWIPVAGQTVYVDVTAFAREARETGRPLAVEISGARPSGANGLVSYASRENANSALHPRLILEYESEAGNVPPVITAIGSVSVPVGGFIPSVPVLIEDENVASVGVAVASDNNTLLPPGSLTLTGSGSAWELAVSPAAGLSGSAVVTVVATDEGGLSSETSFTLTVGEPITRPVLYYSPNGGGGWTPGYDPNNINSWSVSADFHESPFAGGPNESNIQSFSIPAVWAEDTGRTLHRAAGQAISAAGIEFGNNVRFFRQNGNGGNSRLRLGEAGISVLPSQNAGTHEEVVIGTIDFTNNTGFMPITMLASQAWRNESDTNRLDIRDGASPDLALAGTTVLTLGGNGLGGLRVGGPLSDNGSQRVMVRKEDLNTAVLAGSNSYTGPTEVLAGELRIDGFTHAASVVTVRNGGALGGSGQVGGSLKADPGSVLRPGGEDRTGSLMVEGDSVVNGTLEILLNGAFSGSLAVNGILDISGADLAFAVGGEGVTEPFYILASYDQLVSVGGAFASVGGLPLGYEMDYAFNGNQIALVGEGSIVLPPLNPLYWSPGGSTATWNASWGNRFSRNIDGSGDQVSAASTDDIVFSSDVWIPETGNGRTVHVPGGNQRSVHSITFRYNVATLRQNGTGGGSRLTIGRRGITVEPTNRDVTLGTINFDNHTGFFPVYLAGSQTWTNESSGPLDVRDGVAPDSDALGITVLTVGGSGAGGVILHGSRTPASGPETFGLRDNGNRQLGLVKNDPNTLTLAGGTHSYTGPTQVLEGRLIVDGLVAASPINVAAGASISGTGTIGSDLDLAGALRVGIDGATADSLGIGGALNIGAASLEVAVSAAGATQPVYILASYGSLIPAGGTFASVAGIPSGYQLEYAYEGNQIALVAEDPGGTAYELWALAFGLDPAADGAPEADADQDGIPNLVEFALGSHPLVAGDARSGGRLAPRLNEGWLEISYTRSLSAASLVTLVAEQAPDLNGAWTTTGVSDVQVAVAGDIEERTARVPAAGGLGFLRLRVDFVAEP